jgi:hypothetical protein
MRNILIARRDALQTERHTIEQRRVVIDAQLDLLNDIISSLDESDRAAAPEPDHPESTRPSKEAVRGSKLSERWACVVRAAIRRHPNAIKNDGAPEVQIAAGQEPASKEQVRTHVWVSTRDGLYEKVDKGSFRATARAAKIFNIPLGTAEQGDEWSHRTEAPNYNEPSGVSGQQGDERIRNTKEEPDSSELSGAPKTNGAEPLNL